MAPTSVAVREIQIDHVKIGPRFRKEMGDVDALAHSIARIGLLHPIVITDSGDLIAGARRLEAFKLLGRTEIPVHVIEMDSPVQAEHDENTIRKNFTAGEAHAIAQALLPEEREAAKENQREAGRNTGKANKHDASGKKPEASASTTPASKTKSAEGKQSRTKAAKKTGYSQKTLAKIGKIKAAAVAEPARYGDLGEKIETAEHGEVEAIYRELTRRKARREVERQSQQKALTAYVVKSDWRAWLKKQDMCDLLLTDPPYSTDIKNIRAFAHDWLPQALALVKPTGRAYVCIGAYPEELEAYLTAPASLMLSQVLVWTYRNTLGPTPKVDYKLNWQAVLYFRGRNAGPLNSPEMVEQFSVQDLNAPDGRRGDRYHAWQKPEELAERFIRHATNPGDRVLDPFAGTGTFLIAAAKLGRESFGCDADADQVKIAIERGCRHA